VGTDHFVRGVYWPASVFGVAISSDWRWLEHLGWVFFEDIFLLISIRQSIREMRVIAQRQAQMEAVNKVIEARIEERTAELQASRKAALAASNAKSIFLANMSHELRTPLNGIIGMSEVIVNSAPPAGVRGNADIIQKSAASLLTMVNDILDISKIEAGGLALDAREFDLRQLTDDVCVPLRARAEGKGLQLNVRHCAAGEPPWVVGDSVRVRQVIGNLVANAIKFTHRGRVDVDMDYQRTSNGEVAITLRVQDTGIGIRQENLGHLFQRFSQAETTTTRQFGGTGLGLAISKSIIDAMGGSITLASVFGQGSTFTVSFSLPAAVVQPQPGLLLAPAKGFTNQVAIDKMSPDDLATLRKMQILVVEDNEINRLVVIRMFGVLGCTVTIATDGLQAVNRVKQGEYYDCILMDHQMPNMDGWQATAEIRKLQSSTGRRTPIIAMTADDSAGMRERCIAWQMDDYISKPIQLTTLMSTVLKLAPEDAAQPAPH
jgi:signal transduction histidine kinase